MRRLAAHPAHGPYPVHLVSEASAPGRGPALLRPGSEFAGSGLLVHHPSPGAPGPRVHAQVPQEPSPALQPPLALVRRQELGQLLSQEHPQGLRDTGSKHSHQCSDKHLSAHFCPQLLQTIPPRPLTCSFGYLSKMHLSSFKLLHKDPLLLSNMIY